VNWVYEEDGEHFTVRQKSWADFDEEPGYRAHSTKSLFAIMLPYWDKKVEEPPWIPSFTLRSLNGGPIQSEADFAAFLRPSSFSDLTNPMLVLGECKTFGEFDSRDYRRMTGLAKSFPGAILCLCTLRAALTSSEKRRMAFFPQVTNRRDE